ncbi:penicillin-binding protein [Marinoscillum furvescens]|uniref:Cell division protein FtsI (Penicillin-binding protein 3) n=1 Tax=Marinoscillum furvescens DSM 4134 TaxID=1122208 RepID=A0A3D9KWR2_MARFU|nr:penicillin-binding protein [Marinoscillum furvescens]RED92440.1 cell division protein FtsI (penicillin-binding protein 3) [Marinoscillum furvescens DSM 4134]
MSIKKAILLRVRIAFMLVFLFSAGILFRIVTIQYVEGEKWKGYAESMGLQVMKVNATRGNIYADDGSLLATSLPFYRLAFDPYLPADELYNPHIDSLCYLLSSYFDDASPMQYRRKIDRARRGRRRYLILNRQEVGYQDKKRMERWPIFREGRLTGGIIFEKVEKRFLPFSHLGYRTIGTVNSDNRGVVGLEYSFNRQLAGENGEALYQRMAGGGWKPVYDGSEVRPKDGYDIQTTINVNLQDVTESALLKHLQKHRADYGVAVLMEVKTGEIKAISNLSRNSKGEYYERYNYAVGSQGAREPGSTFKLASMIALMEDSNIGLNDTVDTGDGVMKFFNETMRDHKPGGYGVLTVKEVFEKSSNIGTAKLITKHFGDNPSRYTDYLKSIGLDKPLGFQMVGEGLPYIKDPTDSTWSGISLPWISHGYELKMTPLQTLTLYNAVANGGKMIQPLIVKAVKKANKNIERYEPKVLNPKICSKETLRKVRLMLEGVVERGTASNIHNEKYKIAGKTGTAKKVENGRYTNAYYTSFAGYFPADKPQYSCIVVIDEPKGYQIYGSDVAAPVFKEIADKIYALETKLHEELPEQRDQYAGIFPLIRSGKHDELKMIANELGISNHSDTEATWVTTDVVNHSVFWENNEPRTERIPDVRGMTLRDALFVLENMGLKVSVEGRGRVATQSLLPGTRFARGTSIKIDLS